MNREKQLRMNFKSARISGMDASPADLEKINGYALSPLGPEDVFAFKVSMASNQIDRDHEVFPRSTLVKLANLFVGKTVVKDHEHKSDNQLARIFATELVESEPALMTGAGEALTQLVAKCYMVKTSRNADLIAEIQAGIRKEVSLGCRVDKAVCSICGTDNVKTYCEHFPGKRYNDDQLCYFSLENASDAYELSFVAVPAQAHAGTVKSYGKKPCREEEIMARKKALNSPNSGQISRQSEPKDAVTAPKDAENAPNDDPKTTPETEGGESGQVDKGEDVSAKEMLKQLHEIAQQLLVFQKSFMKEKEAEQLAPEPEATQDSEQTSENPQLESSEEKEERQAEENPSNDQDADQDRLTVNRADDQEEEKEAAKDKTAQARLRALDLALMLRRKA